MLTSARDITASVNPPRAVFLDFPLGHTAGRVGDEVFNKAVLLTALDALASDEPGRIIDLPHHWDETDDWKDAVMRIEVSASGEQSSRDERIERVDAPQYQQESDAEAARVTHEGQTCLVCPGIDY